MKKTDKSHIYQNYQRHLVKATVTTNNGINNFDRLVKVYGADANRIELLNKLRKQSKFTIYWFLSFVLLGAVCLVLDFKNSWFNIFDLYILMVNIYLVARGKLAGMYIGVIECLFYAFICYNNQLYGEVIKVMCISIPLNIYTIASWLISMKKQKNKKEKYTDSSDKEDIVIKRIKKKQVIFYSFIAIICVILSFILLKFGLKQKNALTLSAIALTITIVGKILTAQRFMESYAIFLAGDIICLLMWGQTLLQVGFNIAQLSMILYYLACFTNDSYAFSLWKSMYRKIAVNGGKILAIRKVNIKRIIKLRRQFNSLRWNKSVDVAKNS
jgi:nicotinamide mononucleotide transporter